MSCLYQIEYQTAVEMKLVATTLETATDVTYTRQQFDEIFNGGSSDSIWRCVKGYWYYGSGYHNDTTIYYINFRELFRRVEAGLVRSKEYVPDVSADVINGLHMCGQTEFKNRGYMLRPSKGVFVKWKERAKPKKAVVSKQLMNRLKTATIEHMKRVVYVQFGLNIDKVYLGDQDKNGCVLLFDKLGISVDDVINHQHFNVYTVHWGDSTTIRTMRSWLVNDGISEENVELVLDEYRKWWGDCLANPYVHKSIK